MTFAIKILTTFILATASLSSAQTSRAYFSDDSSQRSYLYVFHSKNEAESRTMGVSGKLHEYADTHEGTYLLFLDGGKLYRLDAPATLAEIEQIYVPMKELQAQQAALAGKQKPLAAQQHELGEQMRAARDADTMRQLGGKMQELGQQQSSLGREQCALGRKQGEIGHAVHQRLEDAADSCLKDGSCKPV